MRRLILSSIVALALAGSASAVFAESPKPNTKDPLYQAKGTQHRTYYFKEADDHVVYRLYVPSKWTPSSNMPLLVWINPTLDVDLPFTRGGNVLEKLAEERGYILEIGRAHV